MFVREIRDGGGKARVLCVRERDGNREGEWKQELCVCVREREREREGGVCLIGKQMNNVSFITGMETERRPQQMLCLQQRERESNFSGMIHI